MDRMIAQFGAIPDGDLMLCGNRGVAYQRDMSVQVTYDGAYFDKCAGYEDQEIARKINAGRAAIVNKYIGSACPALDVGVGSGEFIKNRPNTLGYDINPKAVSWLRERMLWSDAFDAFDAFTMWDVLEHVENPYDYFRRMHPGSYLFLSIPIFSDLSRVRESRHYRPGEHLYYFTECGLVDWMALYRFHLLERQDFEISAGRDSILSFAFKREL